LETVISFRILHDHTAVNIYNVTMKYVNSLVMLQMVHNHHYYRNSSTIKPFNLNPIF